MFSTFQLTSVIKSGLGQLQRLLGESSRPSLKCFEPRIYGEESWHRGRRKPFNAQIVPATPRVQVDMACKQKVQTYIAIFGIQWHEVSWSSSIYAQWNFISHYTLNEIRKMLKEVLLRWRPPQQVQYWYNSFLSFILTAGGPAKSN